MSKAVVIKPESEEFITDMVFGSSQTYQNYSWREYRAKGVTSSAIDNTNRETVNFDIDPAVGQIGGSFKYNADLAVTYTVGADIDVTEMQSQDRVGLAPFDFNQCLTNAEVQINSSKVITCQPYKIVNELLQTVSMDELVTQFPTAMYDPLAVTDPEPLTNPLRNANNAYLYTRGLGVVPYTIEPKVDGKITVNYKITGTLALDGTQYFDKQGVAPDYRGVTDLKVTLSIGRDLRHAIQHHANAGNAGQAISVAWGDISLNNLKLMLEMKTPSVATAKAEDRIFYNYLHTSFENDRAYPPTLASGAVSEWLPVANWKYRQVPKLFTIQLFREASSDGTRPRQNFPIVELEIATGSDETIYSGYGQRQFYQLSAKNGYNGRFSDFFSAQPNSNHSSIILKPSDLAQGLSMASNTGQSGNIKISARFRNHLPGQLAGGVVKPEVAIVSDYYLQFVASNGRYEVVPSVVEESALVDAKANYMNVNYANNVIGGNWFKKAVGDVGDWLKRNRKNIRKVRKATKKFTEGIPGAELGHTIAEEIGYGPEGGGLLRSAGAGMSIDDLDY